MRAVFKISILFFLAALFVPVSSSADENTKPRVIIDVPDTVLTINDTILILPIYLSNPYDTIAGVELHIRIEENRHVTFIVDEYATDGLIRAVDTAGTLISGWEWIGINSGESEYYDFKLASMADWPDRTVTPPIIPQDRGVLVKLLFKIDKLFPFVMDTHIKVIIETDKTGFSDDGGNTIGIVTTTERKCVEYVGDSCISWKAVRVGTLDTTVVKFNHGMISIIDSLPPDSGQ